ncbi:putative holin-like toxin [Faecalicatena faecalis]
MTAFETITVIIGILALLISFGSLIIALLAFLDRDRNHKRKK